MISAIGTTAQHGTDSRYALGCRCAPCRTAAVEARKDREVRRRAGEPIRAYSKKGMKHGTVSRYTGGDCRCKQCRDANAAYCREWRARKAAQS